MIERRRVYHMPKNTANADALISPRRELLAFPRNDKDPWNIWYFGKERNSGSSLATTAFGAKSPIRQYEVVEGCDNEQGFRPRLERACKSCVSRVAK